MNMKENILFLRNEWTTTGEVDKTDRTELGKCITFTTKRKETMKHKRFRQKIVFVRCKKKTDNNNNNKKKEAKKKTDKKLM